MRYLILLAGIFCSIHLGAQEFNAKVQVITEGIQATNKQRFRTLEKAITQFINNRRWTDETYAREERIECSFIINITDVNASNDKFTATLQLQLSRPVYNSGYNSPILTHRDNNFSFEYLEFDRLEFAINTFNSNLTSVLAFYAYLMLGYDHDTFSLNGGDPYYAKAQTVLGNAQNNGFTGWGSFDGRKNRFWLIDNLTSPAFEGFRECLYEYHRKGLDLMHDRSKHKEAKQNIRDALLKLEKVNDQRNNSYVMQIWFDTKNQEIANIFSDGEPIKTAELKELLVQLDANNAQMYQKIGG